MGSTSGRVTTSRTSAKVGNVKLNFLMNTKQLSLHPDKTGFIVFGRGEQKNKVMKEITDQPITCGEFTTKRKHQDKWLGDIFNENCLAVSVQATIQDRTPKVKKGIFEIKGIVEDFRSQCMGGAIGALQLWEFSVLPMQLNNSGTWTEISMRHRIMAATLNLAHYLCSCGGDNLAGQVYTVQ